MKNQQHRCYPYLQVMTRAKTNAMYYFILFFLILTVSAKEISATGIREKTHNSWENQGIQLIRKQANRGKVWFALIFK